MINRIGIIYQDRSSRGFLRGLKDRLNCDAEFVEPPSSIGKSRLLTRKQALHAWRYFQKKEVDLVVRFTDADRHRWQDVRRQEEQVVPYEARSLWVCGVAVENPEDWISLSPTYLAGELGIPVEQLQVAVQRTGRVKSALVGRREQDEAVLDVMARIVREAPHEVFRQWLNDDSLQRFYSDCRAAASAANCETRNELEA